MKTTVAWRPLLILFWFLTVFKPGNLNFLEIIDIQANWNGDFVNFNSSIHSDRTKFDIYFTVHRLLHSHDLLMNIKLKAKLANASNYRIIHHWRRVNVCKYLRHFFDNDDSLFTHFFKQSPTAATNIRCPLRKGDYYMKNFELDQGALTDVLQEGSYRVFVELAHVSGEAVKLFALQITANFYDSNETANAENV